MYYLKYVKIILLKKDKLKFQNYYNYIGLKFYIHCILCFDKCLFIELKDRPKSKNI